MVVLRSWQPLPFRASHCKCCHSSFPPSVTKCYGNQQAPLSPPLSWKSLSLSPTHHQNQCRFGGVARKRGWDDWVEGGAEVEDAAGCTAQSLDRKKCSQKQLCPPGEGREFFLCPSRKRQEWTPVGSLHFMIHTSYFQED